MGLIVRTPVEAIAGLAAALALTLIALLIAVLAIAALAALALAVIAHLRALTVGIAIGAQHPVVVFGMLQVVFHGYPVAGGTRVAGHRQVLFHHLIGVAAHPFGAAVVEVLRPRGIMRLAWATPARSPGIRTLSHSRSHRS